MGIAPLIAIMTAAMAAGAPVTAMTAAGRTEPWPMATRG